MHSIQSEGGKKTTNVSADVGVNGKLIIWGKNKNKKGKKSLIEYLKLYRLGGVEDKG